MHASTFKSSKHLWKFYSFPNTVWLIPHSKSEKCEKIHKYAFSFEDQISMNLGFVQP